MPVAAPPCSPDPTARIIGGSTSGCNAAPAAKPKPCSWIFEPEVLVPEMADAGEHHRDTCGVRGGDDLFVAHRPAGLDDRGNSRLDRRLEPVGKREKGVRGEHR